MISVDQAKQIILDHTTPLSAICKPLLSAVGHITTMDIFSPIDLPPFPQSSMDGYAFAFNDLSTCSSLEVKHKIAAGDTSTYRIQEGEAVRIFTGAPIPTGADTVVMQEKTELKSDQLFIMDNSLQLGSNYRHQGAEIQAHSLALPKGSRLTPPAIGFLASMGVEEVEVYRSPTLCILVTGDELTPQGQNLEYGKVYDSNSYTLIAAFKQAGIEEVTVSHIHDQLEQLTLALTDALSQYDVIVLTGGVSVGDYDYVTQAALESGVEPLYHKIKQKPGKPMYCGVKDHRLVFGLPGNPASALTCFYEYLEPALMKMMGQVSAIKILHAPITAAYKKPVGITHFLKAYYDGHHVKPLDAQESFRLNSFAHANALIVIGEEVTEVIEGMDVEVHILP